MPIELEGHGHFTPGLPGGTGLANRGAGVREISGLITQARFIGQDSRHTLLGLTLRGNCYDFYEIYGR